EARALAARLGVADRLDFRGFVPFGPALAGLYRAAHAFVHVSFTEGVPATIVEAFAAGLPVVATDVGGVRTATGGGEGALLVPPDDLPALVAAIGRVADEPELRERLARRGLDLARAATVEAQAARVARYLAAEAGGTASG